MGNAMRRICTLLLCLQVPVVAAVAQVGFEDPPRLAARAGGAAATDDNNGDLYVMGGRADRVLDLWRLRNGSYERVAPSPFSGAVDALAFDAARQCLVAVLRDDAGVRALFEFDGVSWQQRAVLTGGADYQLVYDPLRQQTLMWSRILPTASGQLQQWNGTSLQPLGGTLASGRLAFDAQRGRVVVARHDMVHEWGGASWTTVAAAMPLMVTWQLVEDPTSGRAVAIGIDYLLGTRVAHAWNGATWTPWSVAGMPPREAAIFAGNRARQRLQLLGGGDPRPHNDAFEFDGATWLQVVSDQVDPVFFRPRMAPTGPGTALVFDGGDNSGPVQTARWSNGVFTLLQPAHAPSSRGGFAMAADPASGTVYLFGGADSGGPLGDLWRWDGTDWLQLPGGPPARSGHGLCFDSVRQRLVLYGGTAGNDTWEFDGVQWLLRSASFPPHLYDADLAYDPLRRRSVLVTFGLLGREVWEWDGAVWFSTNPTNRPAALNPTLHAAYDPERHQVVVVDPTPHGNAGAYVGDAHVWDGADWTELSSDARLATVTSLAGVPGVGIVAQSGATRQVYTLTHEHPAQAISFGSPCFQPAWRLSIDRNPWLGTTYRLRYPVAVGLPCLFTTGLSNTSAGPTPLPLDLGAFGMPGCNLYVSPDIVQVRPWSYDAAYLDVSLPSDPAFAGLRLYHQGIVLAPQYDSASQGLEVRLGSLW